MGTASDWRLGTRAWRALRSMVLARDKGLCQIRGPRCRKWATQVDHVLPIADGGAVMDPRNLRAACTSCNSGRAADRTNAMRRAARYRTAVPDYETRF